MNRLFSAFSVLLFSTAILGYLWWGRFQFNHEYYLVATYVLCIAIVIISHFNSRDTLKKLGIRLDNWKSAILWYGGFTFVSGSIIVIAGTLSGKMGALDAEDLFQYCLWAGVQQYLLQDFLRLRVLTAIGNPVRFKNYPNLPLIMAAKIAALIFAAFHAPDLKLVFLTLLGGFFWCLLFSVVPNLFAAWLSQAIIGSLLILFFKQGVLEQFQVGQPGFRYEGFGEGIQVAAGYDDSRNPLIVTLPGPVPNNSARIRTFNWKGDPVNEWEAFDEFGYSGRVAVGDLGFGPGDEIAVCPGPGPGNPALVKIFDHQGKILNEFTPAHLDDGYGCWPAIRDLRLYVSPGPGPGVDQQVLELNHQGNVNRMWKLNLPSLNNGLKSILCSLVLGENSEEKEERLIVWGTAVAQNPSTVVVWNPEDGSVVEFETLPTTFGASATLLNLKRGKTGIAVGPGPFQGYPAWIKVFSLEPTIEVVSDIAPYETYNSCGVNLAAVDIDNDGIDELVIGEGTGPDRPPIVRICRIQGKLLAEWRAF